MEVFFVPPPPLPQAPDAMGPANAAPCEFHRGLELLRLHAQNLSSDSSKRQDFLSKLWRSHQSISGSPWHAYIGESGLSSSLVLWKEYCSMQGHSPAASGILSVPVKGT